MSLVRADHRVEKAQAILAECRSKQRIGQKTWQSMIGQLRSLQVGTPGLEGQFSLLQAGLTAGTKGRKRMTKALAEQLLTCEDLITDTDPIRAEEIVPGRPIDIGACDAAKAGMGGVWFVDEGDALLWRVPFPDEVQRQVVSEANPRGQITNSDLELAGTIMHQHVKNNLYDREGETDHTLCDNTPTVAWRTKGSTTTTKVTAYLLRIAAMQRKHFKTNNQISYITGDDNRMADDASRLWQLSDDELLTYFNLTYPQTKSWTLCHPDKEMSSALISTLSNRTSEMESVRRVFKQGKQRGDSGATSHSRTTSTRDSVGSKTQSHGSTPLASDGETVESHPVGNRRALEQRRTQYGWWARRFPNWATRTRY